MVNTAPKRYRITARWNIDKGHRLQLRLGRERVTDHIPDSPGTIAELRRQAEAHAGFELDWASPDRDEWHENDLVLWDAPAADTYTVADCAA